MKRGFRDSLADIVPVWLSNRPNLNNGYKTLFAIAAVLDCFVEAAVQGVQAAWPGYGTATADYLIAATRQLVQGETESAAAFETRLRLWLDIWLAGSQTWPNRAALGQRIHEYLGNNPRVRVVSRGVGGASNWVTIAADGSISYVNGVALNWDNVSNPNRTNWWSDLWIIIDTPEWAAESRSLTTIALAYGSFTNWAAPKLGIGHPVPRAAVDAITSLVQQWKGAHTNVRGIVWNYTSTDFDPVTPVIPTNGEWGPWAYMATPGTEATPQRKSSDRYWELRQSLPT